MKVRTKKKILETLEPIRKLEDLLEGSPGVKTFYQLIVRIAQKLKLEEIIDPITRDGLIDALCSKISLLEEKWLLKHSNKIDKELTILTSLVEIPLIQDITRDYCYSFEDETPRKKEYLILLRHYLIQFVEMLIKLSATKSELDKIVNKEIKEEINTMAKYDLEIPD